MRCYFRAFVLLGMLLLATACDVSFIGKAADKASPKQQESKEKENACTATFNDFSLDLGALLQGNRKITQQQCQQLFSDKKELVSEQLCYNSDTLGDITLTWNTNTLTTTPLECPESLTEEFSDTAITVTGELQQYVLDDFQAGYSEDVQKIRNINSDEILDLDINGKKLISPERGMEPGDIITLRGKKFGHTIILARDDSSTIKLIRKGEKIK